MNHNKELIKNTPPEELKENVQVCLEHSCAIFLGNYELCKRDEEYIKGLMNIEKGDPNKSDLEFKEALEVFQRRMNSMNYLWNTIGPVKPHEVYNPLSALLLGIIQAFEMSEVPSIIPSVMEALVTGQWRIFILNSAGLASPSGMKIEVIRVIVDYLLKEDFWEWCKRHVCEANECPLFNLYTNQRMKPLEKLLGEAPET
jgi:hypothetical protein